jgi:hypothetical protein
VAGEGIGTSMRCPSSLYVTTTPSVSTSDEGASSALARASIPVKVCSTDERLEDGGVAVPFVAAAAAAASGTSRSDTSSALASSSVVSCSLESAAPAAESEVESWGFLGPAARCRTLIHRGPVTSIAAPPGEPLLAPLVLATPGLRALLRLGEALAALDCDPTIKAGEPDRPPAAAEAEVGDRVRCLRCIGAGEREFGRARWGEAVDWTESRSRWTDLTFEDDSGPATTGTPSSSSDLVAGIKLPDSATVAAAPPALAPGRFTTADPP